LVVSLDEPLGRAVPGIEKFKNIIGVVNYWPLTFVDRRSHSKSYR
jgi:hypothetical protein